MQAGTSISILTLGAALACAQPPPERISGLEAKVDSLSTELRTLEKVLALRGLDIERDRRAVALQDSTFDIPVEGTALLGEAKAPVTVVLFTDLQCPYCAQMAPVLKNLEAEHPKTLRISFRHFPLVTIHDKSMEGHLALWAAGRQGKLWEYYFATTPSFRSLTDSVLVSSARSLGLDIAKFDADRHSTAAKEAVEHDMRLGESLGVQGTPSLYLDGKSTRNPGDIALACARFEGTAKK
jgi:protein-disulfide isomerase